MKAGQMGMTDLEGFGEQANVNVTDRAKLRQGLRVGQMLTKETGQALQSITPATVKSY